MADTKKEYTSNLHPKGDMDTTVYPNVKSENIIDKDTTAYTAGKVPDSSLVSKSLDSLSENLETTKIQVATNKNNIETLQGNYTGLQYQVNTNSSDIALTKTQVETNKTNIAKNTQDIASNTQNIENLSAVMPTDINVDENGHVILEHDGTEITGQKKKLQVIESNFKGSIVREITSESYSNYYSYDFFKTNNNTPFKLETYEDRGSYGNTGSFITFTSSYSITNHAPASLKISFKDRQHSSSSAGFPLEFLARSFDSKKNRWERFDYVFPEKDGIIALTSDLDAKQDKRFVHTVEIHYASNGSYFCFTGTSDKNTPIDSVEKLTTVFANRDLGGVGVFGSAGLSKIHVGSSVNDTTFKKYMNNGEYANPSEETFATVFNTTGFTITDTVTPM